MNEFYFDLDEYNSHFCNECHKAYDNIPVDSIGSCEKCGMILRGIPSEIKNHCRMLVEMIEFLDQERQRRIK